MHATSEILIVIHWYTFPVINKNCNWRAVYQLRAIGVFSCLNKFWKWSAKCEACGQPHIAQTTAYKASLTLPCASNSTNYYSYCSILILELVMVQSHVLNLIWLTTYVLESSFVHTWDRVTTKRNNNPLYQSNLRNSRKRTRHTNF